MNVWRRALVLSGGLMALTAVAARAELVTVNLGVSAEPFVEYGLGPNGDNLGTFAFDQGACAFDGAKTSCTLSGTFTGSSAGFSAGTYTLVTQYDGSNRAAALVGTSLAETPNFFTYTFAAASTSITLRLFTEAGTIVRPVVVAGAYDASVKNLAFSVVPPYSCSGVAVTSCSAAAVGLTPGAIGQSHVTTVVSFDIPAPGPCIGDCNGDRQVVVNELIQMVNIALGNAAVSTCLAGDPNADGDVTVNEIVAGVNNALNGCPS